jgi:PTS system nitrogen regulatory IIA component
MPPVKGLVPGELHREIMEREALMSTGIGRGIALPHPRNPMLAQDDVEPLVAIAFPVQPLDWNTPDGSKVHTVFLIVSSSVKQHLNTLSGINFLCRNEVFYNLIETRASKEKIIAAIKEAENTWINQN